MNEPRDFKGYGNTPPRVTWPGNAPVAVSFVLNVEEGAEMAISSGDDRNESLYEVTDEVVGQRDLCIESHFEYGPRAGYWRIAQLFANYGVPLTLNLCGRALVTTPWLGQHAIAAGHEAMCHGWRWEHHNTMGEDDERAVIRRCIDTFQDILGQRPLGWHVKSHPSPNTRRLLGEEGFLYDSNAYNDDLPVILRRDPAYLVLPYAFDTNDMQFFNAGRFVHGADFARYCCDAFDWLAGEENPKMMTIGLHTRIIGRPGRISGLKAVLDHLTARGAWITRRDAIAKAWLQQVA